MVAARQKNASALVKRRIHRHLQAGDDLVGLGGQRDDGQQFAVLLAASCLWPLAAAVCECTQ
jgi:hypothetical protein